MIIMPLYPRMEKKKIIICYEEVWKYIVKSIFEGELNKFSKVTTLKRIENKYVLWFSGEVI